MYIHINNMFVLYIIKYSINLLTDVPFVNEKAEIISSEVRELGR